MSDDGVGFSPDEVAAKGARGGFIPANPVRPYHDPHYDPLYRACEEHEIDYGFGNQAHGLLAGNYEVLSTKIFFAVAGLMALFIRADAWEAFEEGKGPWDKEVAARFAKTILSAGEIEELLARLERSRVYFTPLGKEADAALAESRPADMCLRRCRTSGTSRC